MKGGDEYFIPGIGIDIFAYTKLKTKETIKNNTTPFFVPFWKQISSFVLILIWEKWIEFQRG